jgi:hypothetical protein
MNALSPTDPSTPKLTHDHAQLQAQIEELQGEMARLQGSLTETIVGRDSGGMPVPPPGYCDIEQQRL